jgi:murein DD-endopeptidase MepM/ murein hydrolase activator NlpD
VTADTSWYGQQTLVPSDYGHQTYAPHQAYEAYGDQYAGYHQYYDYAPQHGYVQQSGYAAQYGYGEHYGTGYATPAAQPASGYGWPDYYQAQHESTLVAEYAGHLGHTVQSAYQGYDAQHDYAAHPDHSVYATVTDASFAAAAEQSHDHFDAVEPFPPGETDVPAPAAVGGDRDALEGDADDVHEVSDYAAARASRRRGVRRRSAVLTIAVPSVAVLGVAGAAAATMGPLRAHHHDTTAATSTASTQAKAQALTAAEARDAAERATRDQARTALQLRQAAARKAAAEAPRYTLPIAYHTGLSALFGQAGTHWMQLHTGIDFPVPEGTPVHAVTGGTVTTEWNPFYGYMVKLTAPDGTVTWYCHLSSYRVRSGQVKVGDIIAYSGDTGNSTGPHLHFEVHPDGGPAVDPLPWLLDRGLDPR